MEKTDALQKKLWEIELEILDVIDKVCTENGLRYSLAYGTLLGAVRHGGFIPWDDDVDIMMPRDDYEKLIKIWPLVAPSGYILQTERMYDDFVNTFLKIRKDHTTFLQFNCERTASYHKGIFVDVFPADRVAPGKISRFLQYSAFAVNLLFNRGYIQESGRTEIIQKAMLKIVPKRYWRKVSNRAGEIGRKWNANLGQPLLFPCTIRDCKRYYPADLFEHLERIIFYGKYYFAFRDRTIFLTIRYGDYRQLPPSEDRIWKHHPIIVDFEKNYEELVMEEDS